MTKQQQEAYDKFLKALDLQDQGIPRQEIYKIVGYASLDSLTKYMRKQGYRYNDQEQKYIQSCNTDSNTISNTISNTDSNTVRTELVETPRQPIVEVGNYGLVQLLEDEQDTLKAMIEWYKNYSSNTNNTSNTLIKIELPQSENVMISTRSNQLVWEQFKIFAKNNSANFKMGDLVAQALLDYMNKYK